MLWFINLCLCVSLYISLCIKHTLHKIQWSESAWLEDTPAMDHGMNGKRVHMYGVATVS